MAFLKFIVIFIVVYYIFKILGRFFAPMLAKKMVEKATRNFEDQFNNPYYKERPATKEGETYIETNPQEKSSKPKSKDEGEYIDYEEVD